MLSRKLISAAAALLTGCLASPAGAQNLEAGKTPSQIFTQTCSLCHKSARGLSKTVPPGSLAAFLRQHYTTSTDMAAMLSAYVLSNGATDTRLGGDNLTKQGKEARAGTGPEVKPPESKPSENKLLDGVFGGRLFESKPAEPKPPAAVEAKPEQRPKPERRTREASRPDVDDLENIPPGAVPPTGSEAAPTEGEQKGKKSKFDKKKPPVSAAKLEPKVEPSARPTPSEAAKVDAKTEAKGEPQIRPDPVPMVTPAPSKPESAQKTAEEKS
ncbi:MAG: hypothetical protein K2X60_13440, partial [Xanthobacteraceae bacterium]|nr:hypothetical protein [Xanthobacteraceae bacterium]